MTPFTKPAGLFILIGLFTACVPARKYEELQTRYKSTQESEAAALAKAQQAEAAMKEQTAGMDDVVKRKANLERDTTIQGTSLRNIFTQ